MHVACGNKNANVTLPYQELIRATGSPLQASQELPVQYVTDSTTVSTYCLLLGVFGLLIAGGFLALFNQEFSDVSVLQGPSFSGV